MKIYIARQPIYGIDKKIFGYELLYRNEKYKSSCSEDIDGNSATRTLISDAITAFGLEKLTKGTFAFVNFTHDLIMSEIPQLLNPKDFIIEILEDAVVDENLINQIIMLKEKGYIFALDDYVGDPRFDVLIPIVDIVKTDLLGLSLEDRANIANMLVYFDKRMLAEKIETEEEFEDSKKKGYTLFQGYYFEKPLLLTASLPEVQNSTCINVFSEVLKEDIDFANLANIIKTDVSLSYKLLKHINTLKFYRGTEVSSIYIALLRMGSKEVRRWISLVFIREITNKQKDEKIKIALIRGLFAEKISHIVQQKKYGEEAFFVGTFSMLETLMEEDFIKILDSICVSNQVKEALILEQGILYYILKFVKEYEVGNVDAVMEFIDACELDSVQVAFDYMESVKYAEEIFAT